MAPIVSLLSKTSLSLSLHLLVFLVILREERWTLLQGLLSFFLCEVLQAKIIFQWPWILRWHILSFDTLFLVHIVTVSYDLSWIAFCTFKDKMSGEEGSSSILDLRERKPYTITRPRERWTTEEHQRFLEALSLHGRAWRRIQGVPSTDCIFSVSCLSYHKTVYIV